jgi:hypothetical protein
MAATRDRWVVCEEYTAGPYTPEQAAAKVDQVGKVVACHLEHSIVISDTAPVPPWKQNLEGGY